MTQELNKEALYAAARAYEDDAGFVHDDALHDAIQAYLSHIGKLNCDDEGCPHYGIPHSHPKVTGFEDRIADAVDDLHDNGFDDVIVLLEDMQAALAGGGNDR